MTPYEINLLLHFYITPTKPKDTPILQTTINQFLDMELIKIKPDSKDHETKYGIARRGTVMIKRMISMPLPLYPGE